MYTAQQLTGGSCDVLKCKQTDVNTPADIQYPKSIRFNSFMANTQM